mmetsp:Transcript_31062/g.82615  ORF Transcript_31062/g.82615 Transcript_31062/m.82615 type:complete len:208 (+) Transcript_31062:690-1313(+)
MCVGCSWSGGIASGVHTETTNECHSRAVKCLALVRMILTTASSMMLAFCNFGTAIWISSKDKRPERKKSLMRSRPVCSRQKTDAMDRAASLTCCFVGEGPRLGLPVPVQLGLRRWRGTGKSGTLNGALDNPSQNMRLVSCLGSGLPAAKAFTAPLVGASSATKTSLRSPSPSSGGHASITSRADKKDCSSNPELLPARWAAHRAIAS